MDSVTQIMLGAAVGQAVIGHKVGRKALVWGAICGTLPDLDVFIPFGGAVEDFTFHRSFSHSLLVQALIAPLIVWIILKCHPQTREHRQRWFWLVLLALWTHALLDSFTVYGTQLFWPLSEYPVGFSSIFIIDPIYTVPLIIGVCAAAIIRRHPQQGIWLNYAGLFLSSLYLGWTLIAKGLIEHRLETAMADQGIESDKILTTPAPFNTLLWRAVIMDDTQYHEAYLSVLDTPEDMTINSYPTEPALLTALEDEWGVQRLQWFTKGFYIVRQEGDQVVLSDLRMGVEGSYVFNFQVGSINQEPEHRGVIFPGTYKRVEHPRDLNRLSSIWARIWDASISLAPMPPTLSQSPTLESCSEPC
ncbi:metal-dependent hydrolase [Hahella ganghwensis]|uniref:metal-dependent hydrolase n=1 Tax=Hahella ganghwensis TaxID=286420 RepID=UPI00035FF771|nr:metal-dependent hydrolase [Hahella ganghwensis]